MIKNFTIVAFFITYLIRLYSQEATGEIRGQLTDVQTKAPLIGANVTIPDHLLGAATDTSGCYIIHNVPFGSYSLQFAYMGYETVTKTDVIIRPARITTVNADLTPSFLQNGEIEVAAGYFSETENEPVSKINFSREEIRRSPGSAGDVSRIILTLPGVAKVDDQSNNLVIRGGSPLENTFYIDGIEVPNINHFQTQGASGGAIGILNVDLIEDINLYTGGFNATYGDKLSSIMEIAWREGNHNQYDGQIDLNIAGFGGVFEGPVPDKKGSFFISCRRSYLDFLIKHIDVGSTIAPNYGDFQGKLTYTPNPSHKFSLIQLWSDDHMHTNNAIAKENKMTAYGDQDNYQFTGGITWQALWSGKSYSHTSLAYTANKFKEDFFETVSTLPLVKNRSLEQSYTLRSITHYRFNPQHILQYGFEDKILLSKYDNQYLKRSDAVGNPVPPVFIHNNLIENKLGLFFSYDISLWNKFTVTCGLRYDYLSLNRHHLLSPRMGAIYRLNKKTSFSASGGLFHQSLPSVLLAMDRGIRRLKDIRAWHYALNMTHMLTPSSRITIEAYHKSYQNFPMDANQPMLFLIDEIYYHRDYGFNAQFLQNSGQAFSQGVEAMVQKKLATDFYGLISLALFKTHYQGLDGIWRDRIFDNRFILSIDGGYKPNKHWEFSARWTYAGGRPYTPFDLAASERQQLGILDITQINRSRYPAYHILNLRMDRRFHFFRTNLVCYLSIMNAYNRRNVAENFWNRVENRPDVIYQWSMLPVIGFEYEF